MQWSTSQIDDLPDSSFLHIEGGGKKDKSGKTTPRALRHFPFKDASGSVDMPHLRNALARIPQSSLSEAVKSAATSKATAELKRQKKDSLEPDESRELRLDDYRTDGRVLRMDFTPIKGAKITTQGFLKFDAALGRTGVLKYTQADGSVRHEFRPPAEVFAAMSMDTAADAIVTDKHPPEGWITAGTWKQYARGHVSGPVHQEDNLLMGQVTVTDPEMIGMIQAGQRKEISPGYACKLDCTPGRWDGVTFGPDVKTGQPYDAIQREIVHNSIGLGPDGWGRQGSSVALRLDAQDASVAWGLAPDESSAVKSHESSSSKDRPRMENVSLRLDGLTVQVTQEASEVILKALAERDSAVGAGKSALSAMTAERDALAAKVVKLDGDIVKMPEQIRGAIRARLDLETQVQKVLGPDVVSAAAFKLDGKSDRELRTAVLAKVSPSLRLDAQDDVYVTVAFDMAMKDFKEPDASAKARASLFVPSDQRTDAGDDKPEPWDLEAARAEHRKRNQEGWRPNKAG